MSLDKTVEAIIKEAQERGEFENLEGAGKPLDLTAYFETPEELRLAYSALKNAGFVAPEVELLQEIAALKERLAVIADEGGQEAVRKLIRDKQLQFVIMIERQRRRK